MGPHEVVLRPVDADMAPQGVCIVPLDEAGVLLLRRQGEAAWGLPCADVPEEDDPFEVARTTMHEVLGIIPGGLVAVGDVLAVVDPGPGDGAHWDRLYAAVPFLQDQIPAADVAAMEWFPRVIDAPEVADVERLGCLVELAKAVLECGDCAPLVPLTCARGFDEIAERVRAWVERDHRGFTEYRRPEVAAHRPWSTVRWNEDLDALVRSGEEADGGVDSFMGLRCDGCGRGFEQSWTFGGGDAAYRVLAPGGEPIRVCRGTIAG